MDPEEVKELLKGKDPYPRELMQREELSEMIRTLASGPKDGFELLREGVEDRKSAGPCNVSVCPVLLTTLRLIVAPLAQQITNMEKYVRVTMYTLLRFMSKPSTFVSGASRYVCAICVCMPIFLDLKDGGAIQSRSDFDMRGDGPRLGTKGIASP